MSFIYKITSITQIDDNTFKLTSDNDETIFLTHTGVINLLSDSSTKVHIEFESIHHDYDEAVSQKIKIFDRDSNFKPLIDFMVNDTPISKGLYDIHWIKKYFNLSSVNELNKLGTSSNIKLTTCTKNLINNIPVPKQKHIPLFCQYLNTNRYNIYFWIKNYPYLLKHGSI